MTNHQGIEKKPGLEPEIEVEIERRAETRPDLSEDDKSEIEHSNKMFENGIEQEEVEQLYPKVLVSML
jgi:hypothetical protein